MCVCNRIVYIACDGGGVGSFVGNGVGSFVGGFDVGGLVGFSVHWPDESMGCGVG